MSLFDKNIIEQEYSAKQFYDIRIDNAVHHPIEKNMKRIFNTNRWGENIYHGVLDFFNQMPVTDFEKILNKLIRKCNDKYCKSHLYLRRFLNKSLGVKKERLKYSSFYSIVIYKGDGVGGSGYTIFIPNGAYIQYGSSEAEDGINIVFEKK